MTLSFCVSVCVLYLALMLHNIIAEWEDSLMVGILPPTVEWKKWFTMESHTSVALQSRKFAVERKSGTTTMTIVLGGDRCVNSFLTSPMYTRGNNLSVDDFWFGRFGGGGGGWGAGSWAASVGLGRGATSYIGSSEEILTHLHYLNHYWGKITWKEWNLSNLELIMTEMWRIMLLWWLNLELVSSRKLVYSFIVVASSNVTYTQPARSWVWKKGKTRYISVKGHWTFS